MSLLPDPAEFRQPDHAIEPLLYLRWSPRAMTGEPISEEEMLTLFEAARWAPSTYNEQEWRFLYARRGTAHWPSLFGLLMEANQVWCQHAAMLVVILAHKVFKKDGKPNPVHLFDCGSAFENVALQGTAMGLVVHGMSGFDFERAHSELKVPDDYAIAAMFAVGRPGDPDKLPEKLRQVEAPSGRRLVKESIQEGPYISS